MSDSDDLTYRQLIANLLEDGERFAKARLKLYRALVFYRVSQARASALLMLFAVLLAAGAMVALMLAIVVTVGLYTGPFWAGIIVGGTGLAIAALLGWLAVRNFPDLDEKVFDEDTMPWLPEEPGVPEELLRGAEKTGVEP